MNLQQILLRFWGYGQFRPLQEDIIRSVIQGRDTLALLPTGGGKSLCYQVPALAMPGICIVITPLIALMKDQVENLERRGVKALAVYSGLDRRQIDIALDEAVSNPEVKLLYLSPERLLTTSFMERFRRMKVNIIAVDEAHCISQWGYDFRPPYLRIAEIRPIHPGVPVLALTATATPAVVNDICQRLGFTNGRIFQKSFERTNLVYAVRKEEDKNSMLLKLVRSIRGTGIVYVRNRKKTREVAAFLTKNGFSADYYHAGISQEERDKRQQQWKSGKVPLMVCTNAFGMGIDKPDVRLVVHLDLPDSIEAYFQEAGRAGRDEKKAFAVLLYENSDITDAFRNYEMSYPEQETIRQVYNTLGNHFRIPLGTGRDVSFPFDMSDFCEQNSQTPAVVHSSLRFLEREGYIGYSENLNEPSKIQFIVGKQDLYRYQVRNPKLDNMIKLLLRMYTGLFSGYARVSEEDIARKSGVPPEQIGEILQKLHSDGIIIYDPRSGLPRLTFVCERLDTRDILLSKENYSRQKENALKRLDAMIEYVSGNARCRSQTLLAYFGEKNAKRCGECDICRERNKLELTEMEFNSIRDIIKPVLRNESLTLDEVIQRFPQIKTDKLIAVMRWLTDNGKLIPEKDGKYHWY